MVKMDKRFNLRRAIKHSETIRAKILCLISWLFKIHILIPTFEWEARERKGKKV